MPNHYFSDRERGPMPQTITEVTEAAWNGIVALINRYILNGSFGIDFPAECPDGVGIVGTNNHMFGMSIRGEIPDIDWPLDVETVPSTLAVMDLIEFCYEHVAEAHQTDFHKFFGHHHLSFDRSEGQDNFRTEINRIFSRNQLAYELSENGQIVRIAAPVYHELLTGSVFQTGDTTLNELLESARAKFLAPDTKERHDSLEKIWDAWERIKTIEDPDKRASVSALLNQAASEPKFREVIEEEARALTDIGNTFLIRHSETSQIPLQEDEHVDYLFYRLFALIWLLLRSREA